MLPVFCGPDDHQRLRQPLAVFNRGWQLPLACECETMLARRQRFKVG